MRHWYVPDVRNVYIGGSVTCDEYVLHVEV